MTDKNNVVTLGEWANIAIAKYSSKMLKNEAGVLKDRDPENLHRMRVGMRRLRSGISSLAMALDLPHNVNEKNIAKVGRSLGKLRDLDVLLVALNNFRSHLPKVEQKSLDKVLRSLNKQRKREFKQVQKTLNSKLYIQLKQGIQNWLEQPKFQTIAVFSLDYVLPDLLAPQISQLLLHPGWLIGVELKKIDGKINFSQILKSEGVEQLLTLEAKEEVILHDLRKEAKKTRYNLELYAQFYDDTYQHQLQQIEQIQEVLGQIQDCYVLNEVLSKVLKSKIGDKMPQLATLIAQTRYQKWQEWELLQQQFLEDATRKQLRQIIQQPLILNPVLKQHLNVE